MGTLVQEMPKHFFGPGPIVRDADELEAILAEPGHSPPVDSPPILKKKLRRLSSSVRGSGVNALGALPLELVAVSKKSGREIGLTRRESSPALLGNAFHAIPQVDRANSILKANPAHTRRSLRLTRGQSAKRVQFVNDVTVHLVSEDGVHICTQAEHLNNYDATSRREFIARNLRRLRGEPPLPSQISSQYSPPPAELSANHSPSSELPRPVIGQRGQATAKVSQQGSSAVAAVDNNAYDNIPALTSPTDSKIPLPNSINSSKVNITFQQDKDGTKLKFVILLGLEFSPEDIVVKANMNGSRIRVLATRMRITDNGQQVVEDFNERYALPMSVDPFMVEARLDTKGYLTVTAPLMTLARRQELSKDKPTSSSASSSSPSKEGQTEE